MLKFVDDAKLKFGVWNRERKERAEARKAEHQDPANVTIPLSLVQSAKLAAWMAYFSLVYFLWLYTLDIARDRAASLHLTHVGGWIGDLQFYFPYIVGFAVVAVGIPYVAKIAIPTFMSLSWRGNFWPKLWALFIAMAVSLVVIAGTFTVQGDTIMERDRDAAVAVEGVQQNRSMIEGQIAAKEAELRSMMENRNAYLAQAASVGAVEWQRSYIDQTDRNDPQRDRIVRALGAARAADAVRAELLVLRQNLASSGTLAAVQGEVVTERTSWIADTLGWLEGVRAILLSLVMDIVCLIMPWIALRLEQARNRQMGMVAGIPQHPWMIEKPREGEKSIRPEEYARRSAQDVVDAMIEGGADPRFAADMARSAARSGVAMEEMYDAETGEKLTYRKGTWVRPPKRNGKGREGTFQAEAGSGAIERGAEKDGGNRSGVTLGGRMDLPAATDAAPTTAATGDLDVELSTAAPQDNESTDEVDHGGEPEQQQNASPEQQTEPPIDFEALAAEVAEESAPTFEQPDAERADDDNGSGDVEAGEDGAEDVADHSEEPHQPEQREDRLLAPPSVAAE